MTLQFYTKHVYGLPTMYLVDQNVAEAVRLFNNHKTMTDSDKKALEKLGFSFTEVVEPKTK